MNTQLLNSWPMDQLDSAVRATAVEWLWEGYLARGSITLLTGVWKGGKTTLVAGLLRALVGGSFLDRTCAAARALVVSEEAPSHWIERRQAIPIGPHVQLVSRPFPGRPTQEQWDELVGKIEAHRSAVAIDVLVVDSLAVFLPGSSESDPVALNALFQPLRRLANAGVGVLILHHPRKRKAEEGKSARGGETLLEMVDIALELSRHGPSPAEACQRKLVGRSCYPETPRTLIYEWTPGTALFRTLPDVLPVRFRENWEMVRAILARRTSAATHKELLAEWPPDKLAPSPGQLYEWLSRAVAEKLAVRTGTGTKSDPYRYRLASSTDKGRPNLKRQQL
jgi:AAA domain-containing protein